MNYSQEEPHTYFAKEDNVWNVNPRSPHLKLRDL